MRPDTKLVVGTALAVIGLLMFVFNQWKVWRSRWFSLGGLFGQRQIDEKTALFATRFWGAVTFLAGIVFVALYYKDRL